MDIGGGNWDFEALQKAVRRARIQRDAALGEVIGEACAATWRAIMIGKSRLLALVMRRGHA